MPVLCDFTQIVGDAPVNIGDALPVWEKNFNTGGRHRDGTAFIIFNIRGLTYADANIDVKINNRSIGRIYPYPCLNDADRNNVARHWYTQMIAMNGSELNNGDNEIQINAVGFAGSNNANRFDDFEIKDVMCFFHQSA